MFPLSYAFLFYSGCQKSQELFEQLLTKTKRGCYLISLLDGPDLELADRFLCCISQTALKKMKGTC